MSSNTFYWENHLLALAQQEKDGQSFGQQALSDPSVLARAYPYCEQLTRYHSKTFYTASGLLPKDKRKAVRALYAFCRVTDDLVDCESENAIQKLHAWRNLTLDSEPTDDDAVAIAWADTRYRYNIPWCYVEQLLNGVAMDLRQSRYQNFGELTQYCYGVACTVGLMSMHIIGFSGSEALPYAIRLGVALQMTNILRDVGDDWRNGRIYLPQDELASHQIDEQDIANGVVDGRWREFMRFQIERVRQLYAESLPGIAMLNRDGRFAIAAAAELYRGILDEIEANDYDNFNRRASLSTFQKVSRLPGIWWQAQTNQYRKQNVLELGQLNSLEETQ